MTDTNIDARTGRDVRYNYGLHATIHVQQLRDWAEAILAGEGIERVAGEMTYRADEAQVEWDEAEERRKASEAEEAREKALKRRKR
jgi:hypothetical protein